MAKELSQADQDFIEKTEDLLEKMKKSRIRPGAIDRTKKEEGETTAET